MISRFVRITNLLSVSLFIFGFAMEAHSKDFWWPYLASYEAGPGSIRVNLGLRKQSPLVAYPYLIVTGTTYTSSRADGLPEPKDLERLNALSELVVAEINKISPSVYVGTFTHNREQLHYVYVKDASRIKSVLDNLYLTRCKGCKTYFNNKHDPTWSAYNEFLYPNQAIIELNKAELKNFDFTSK